MSEQVFTLVVVSPDDGRVTTGGVAEMLAEGMDRHPSMNGTAFEVRAAEPKEDGFTVRRSLRGAP